MRHTCKSNPLPASQKLMRAIAFTASLSAGLALPIRGVKEQAQAQTFPQTFAWGWGSGNAPAAAPGAHEPFADYLLTGQKPHLSVARIVAPENAGVSLGSGVLVDVNRTQALVLTNWHVIRDSRSAVLVQFPDGFQSAGTVVRWDEPWDLAAIVIWKPHAVPVTIAERPPLIGEPLTIAGYGRGPFRAETGNCTEYLSPGAGYPKEFVELAATARQGDSGGPILNERGELAGVLFGQSDGRTIGSCSSRVRTFLASVGSKGFTAMPLAEFSNTPALDRGIGTSTQQSPVRFATAPLDQPQQRSMHVGGMPSTQQSPSESTTAFSNPPLPTGQFPASDGSLTFAHSYLNPSATLAEILDIFTNGRSMLIAVGGMAMAILGLRTIFGGRR